MEQFLRTRDGVELCFEVFGSDTDPTVVLIMGLNLDLLWWRDDFCAELVTRGLRVVRFDNRDVGRSTRFDGPDPTPWQYVTRRPRLTYTLEDMAGDTAALIKHVAPSGAHVVGVSMGALIAQTTAVEHPALVRSLVSIMGRPGDRRSGRMARRYVLEWFRPVPRDPVEGAVVSFRRIGSRGRTEADDADVRDLIPRSAVRGDDSGGGRQLAAIFRERDRTARLRGFDRPALVIHGDHDRVIKPSGGRATAAALPDAQLMILPGMGHDLARRLWPDVVAGLAAAVRRGEEHAGRS